MLLFGRFVTMARLIHGSRGRSEVESQGVGLACHSATSGSRYLSLIASIKLHVQFVGETLRMTTGTCSRQTFRTATVSIESK